MHERNGFRRVILGTVMAMLAVSVALGGASGTSAADAEKDVDNGSSDAFKERCEMADGVYSEDKIGNTNCHWGGDGGWTQCDANGNDCWYTPPKWQPQGDQGPHLGPGGLATDDTEETNPAQVVDRPGLTAGASAFRSSGPTASASEVDRRSAKAKHAKDKKDKKDKKGKKGKKHGKGGKGRRR